MIDLGTLGGSNSQACGINNLGQVVGVSNTAIDYVIPAKFTLMQYAVPTCALSTATISVTRTAGGTLGAIDENTYGMAAESGSNFTIEPNCLPVRLQSCSLFLRSWSVSGGHQHQRNQCRSRGVCAEIAGAARHLVGSFSSLQFADSEGRKPVRRFQRPAHSASFLF
jgi:hypothetical protein